MTGFCGELSLRGETPDLNALNQMRAAIVYWGNDQSGSWAEGPVTLSAEVLHLTPWSVFEHQPVIDGDDVFVGHVRLDDRLILSSRLGISTDDLNTIPDSQLLLLAWQRWGEACVEHLVGDWVCAIWNKRKQTLWLARDAAGNTCLYYWRNTQRIVFSTSLKALLAHPAVPKRVNELAIACQLALVMTRQDSGTTVYQDIYRLSGGQAIRCVAHSSSQADAGVSQPYTWWQPEHLSPFDWRSDADYYDAFNLLYTSAIADRLHTVKGPVSLMLSAGLDSTSIASIAAPLLAASNQLLMAFTSVPQFKPDGAAVNRLGDEGALAKSVAEQYHNINFIPCPSSDHSVVGAIERMLTIHDQPGHAAGNYYWMLDIFEQAKKLGSRVLLTGQGGNATVSWAGNGSLWPALRAQGPQAAFNAFVQSQLGTWLTFKRQFLKPFLAPVRDRVHQYLNRNEVPWQQHSAIAQGFVDKVGLAAYIKKKGYVLPQGGSADDQCTLESRYRLGKMASASLGAIWMENGAAYQFDVLDPTRDRRIIEFCWRVPDRIYWANGLQRGLITKGMDKRLPTAILKSRDKGLQAADVGYRVLAERQRVLDAIATIQSHPLARECLDTSKLVMIVNNLANNVTPATTQQAMLVLLKGLSIGLFLTRF
jgi:asparagine synthase (glutamine-hydrolysing)